MVYFARNPHNNKATLATSLSMLLLSFTMLLLSFALQPVAYAQGSRLQISRTQEISVDAQSFESLKDRMVLHQARIAQGDLSVSADEVTTDQAIAKGFNFDNGHWTFHNSVKIILPQGQVTADEAQITFSKKLLSKAVITGKPAKFQQLIVKSGRLAQGHADSIEYDVVKGTVHLANNAYLTDGQTEFSGASLKYNMQNQTVVADASEQRGGRVHIIIPPPGSTPP